jgi:hypothetical protein
MPVKFLSNFSDTDNPKRNEDKYMRYTQPKILTTAAAISAIQISEVPKGGMPSDSDPAEVNATGTAYEADE